MAIELTASIVRQWSYCPRVPYFTYVMPVIARPSVKMETGQRHHQALQALERRRLLKRYGLEDAERTFNVRLHSPVRNLTGIIDMLLKSGEFHYPVEFKHSRRDGFQNHKLQLAAYGALIEEVLGGVCPYGFIHNSWSGRTYKVDITDALKAEFESAMMELRGMIKSERLPEPTPHRAKCVDCEFRNWCGDVL